MSIHDEFDDWLARREVALHGSQWKAVHALLDATSGHGYFFKARATGVTYTLRLLEEFLKSRRLDGTEDAHA